MRPGLIRAAGTRDLAAVQAIYADYVRHSSASFELVPPDLAEIERRYASVREAGLPFLVAVDAEDDVLGYAYVGEYRTRPGYRYCCEHSIYLAPASRGRGLGSSLLRAIMDGAAAAGRTEMIAVVGGGLENTASIALHQRLGFRLVGVLQRVGYKFDRWWDSALLQARLGVAPDV